MLLHRTVFDLPGMRQILRGVQAVAWGMRKSVPEEARASFEHIEPLSDTVEVSREWGFPLLEYLQSDPNAGIKDLQGLQGSLGEMIGLWNSQEQLFASTGIERTVVAVSTIDKQQPGQIPVSRVCQDAE